MRAEQNRIFRNLFSVDFCFHRFFLSVIERYLQFSPNVLVGIHCWIRILCFYCQHIRHKAFNLGIQIHSNVWVLSSFYFVYSFNNSQRNSITFIVSKKRLYLYICIDWDSAQVWTRLTLEWNEVAILLSTTSQDVSEWIQICSYLSWFRSWVQFICFLEIEKYWNKSQIYANICLKFNINMKYRPLRDQNECLSIEFDVRIEHFNGFLHKKHKTISSEKNQFSRK